MMELGLMYLSARFCTRTPAVDVLCLRGWKLRIHAMIVIEMMIVLMLINPTVHPGAVPCLRW